MKKYYFYLVSLIMFSNLLYCDNRPKPICSNAKKIAAYDMSSSIKNTCSEFGVNINGDKLRNEFIAMIGNEFDRCKEDCLTMDSLEGIKMNKCVNIYVVKSYVDSFLKSVPLSKENCIKIKNK